MTKRWISLCPLCFLLLVPSLQAEDDLGDPAAIAPLERQAWTTSRIIGSPDPPPPYVAEWVFPSLSFKNPVVLTSAPGSDRLFVAELDGRLYSFPNRPDCEQADLLLDMKSAIADLTQVYGMTFHPRYPENGYVYICYVLQPELPEGTRVSRFRVTDENPPRIDPESEQIIITWLSGGHNGGCLKFGPDRYLYIATGDAVGPNPPDTLNTGQDVSDLLSSILRIDVDAPEAGQPYRVPPDNPFVGLAGARPEVWAYGFRNPWKMSFDERTGDLWTGDVGWELWEMVYRVEKGGNYGWSIMEGRQPINPQGQRGPTPILPPIVEHPHSEAASITGGFFYYGDRLPELQGSYIYGDYETGKLWGLRYADGQVIWHQELTDTTLRIIGFGLDHAGELYFMDYTAGTIHRLAPNTSRDGSRDFPRTLSASGLFSSVADHALAPGVIGYSINAEPWSDYALAERFIALPDRTQVDVDRQQWRFPVGSVLMKTLSMPMGPSAEDRQRIETQLLHFDGQAWNAYTYAWNEQQTEAVLVEREGMDRLIKVSDPAAPGGVRQQRWRYASRAECLRCHNPWSGTALAMNSWQLDKPHEYGRTHVNQLEAWVQAGLLDQSPPLKESKRLVDPYDASAPLEQRARSYLHANCAHCHRMHAGGAVLTQMVLDVPLQNSSMIDVPPSQGSFGIEAARVIAPRDPCRSVLFYRMSKTGSGRMPYLGSELVDLRGIELMYRWIEDLPTGGTSLPQDTAAHEAAQLRTRQQQLIALLPEAVSQQELLAAVDALVQSTSGALRLMHALDEGALEPDREAAVVDRVLSSSPAHVQDLFKRFLPPDQQSAPIPVESMRADVLRLAGDPERGRYLFAEAESLQCRNCHRLGAVGQAVGPDLDEVARKQDRGQLLDSILKPSERIDPQYRTYVVETEDGRLVTGLLLERTAEHLVLRDAQGNQQRLAASDVLLLAPQPTSLMPELLLRDMTAQDVADLLTYLEQAGKG